jgi:RNA-directed DNA polymerase
METLWESYILVKANDGAPGIDGMTFDDIEHVGEEEFLKQIQEELCTQTYRPLGNRKKEIPKDGGTKVRVLSIPSIRDRVVQGALKLILEPIFEADFQPGSFGYRPGRSAHEAVNRVAEAIVKCKTRVIDIDLRAYFDSISHCTLLEKVAQRVNDPNVMHLLKMILKASGKKGVPQGGVISPLLSNLYLNEVDKMLEKAKEVTRLGEYTHLEYARFADDLVILVDFHPKHEGLLKAVEQRLREELALLQVEVNEEKSRIVDLAKGESFGFLGFDFRRVRSIKGAWRPQYTPKLKKIFRRFRSQPVNGVVEEINPILRGWVNYFAMGHSGRCFKLIRDWVEKKIRRHLMRARKTLGFGWKRWSRQWLYTTLGLFDGYRVTYRESPPKVAPTG